MQNTKSPPGKGAATKRDSGTPGKTAAAKPKASHPRKDGLAKYAREVGARLK